MSVDVILASALRQKRIVDYTHDEMLERCSFLLRQCHAMCGSKLPESKDLAILVQKLATDLELHHAYLSVEEVSYCFELGIKGEYGEFYGVNFRSFTKWLKAYKSSDLRYQAKVALQREAEQKALPAVSEEYKREREDAFLQSVFRQYKAGYPLERLYPAHVYLVLQRRGVIRHTPEEKWEAMAMFANYRPVQTHGCASQLPIPEETQQWLVKAKAMEWLLRREFDGIKELKLR